MRQTILLTHSGNTDRHASGLVTKHPHIPPRWPTHPAKIQKPKIRAKRKLDLLSYSYPDYQYYQANCSTFSLTFGN
jgi:hypothetical protein